MVKINKEKCIGCGACVAVCPEGFELKNGKAQVDYIHGIHHIRDVVKETNGLGILMPEFSKNELFNFVINVGNLPKKAFSIGTAENKKYYLEAKRIK